MGAKKWCPSFFLKKMGVPENKKRWAKNGLLKMQNRNSLKSKRNCDKEKNEREAGTCHLFGSGHHRA